MKGERKLSLDVALLASFAALYAVVLKLLPGIPAYGFPGAKIKVAVVLSRSMDSSLAKRWPPPRYSSERYSRCS